jgi:hypothetical protein
MTKKRDREDMDALVSETYRELPAPRAPDHLNQTILRMAEKKGRGKADLLFATWVKPVTLAATIALSLAIVLELTEVPVTSVQMEVEPAAREELVPQESDRLDEGPLEELVLEDTDLAKSEAKGKIESFSASPPAAALPVARKRTADIPESNQPVAISTVGLAMEIGESEVTAACDERARRSADSWLACIDQLRESGATLEADQEYEAFILEYPTGSADSESNK